jgi:hypothetical protein
MGFYIEQIDEADAARIAHIMGPCCAHALALDELKQRREKGEDPVMGRRVGDGVLVVVSRKHTTDLQTPPNK